jgi:hypothetical protein
MYVENVERPLLVNENLSRPYYIIMAPVVCGLDGKSFVIGAAHVRGEQQQFAFPTSLWGKQ